MGNKCCCDRSVTTFAELFGTWNRIRFLLVWQFLLCSLSVVYSIIQMQGSKVAVPSTLWPTGANRNSNVDDVFTHTCEDRMSGFFYWSPFSFDLQLKNDPSSTLNLSCGYTTGDTIWRLIIAILALICIVTCFLMKSVSWLSSLYYLGDKFFFCLTLFYYAALVNDIKCFQIGSSACAQSFYEKDIFDKAGVTVTCTMSIFLITIAIDFVCGANLLLIWRAWSCCPELVGAQGQSVDMHLPVATNSYSSRDIVTTAKQQEQPPSSFASGEGDAEKVPSTTSGWFVGTKHKQSTYGKKIENYVEEGFYDGGTGVPTDKKLTPSGARFDSISL